MAVMSFAHLKNKKAPAKEKAPAPSSRTINPVRDKAGVMSFAHLKNKKPAAVQEQKKTKAEPRIFRIPVIMPTASLVAVNYCYGCPRFLPALEPEKKIGNPYGRCLRTGDIDSDTTMSNTRKITKTPYQEATVRMIKNTKKRATHTNIPTNQ